MVNISNNTHRGISRKNDSRTSARSEGNKVYVSNIDFSCTHQELKDAFCKVGEVAFVEMLKDSMQRPKGCAIIRFKENNIAENAIRTMNRVELKGRKIVVKDEREVPREENGSNHLPRDRKRGREDDLPPNDHHRFKRPPPPPHANFGNTYGLSMQFLQSLGIDGPLSNRVFVANLDYSVNEAILQQLFDIAGKVTDVELVKGDDGKSKGFGFIDFEHPVEAVQAISMLHNQIYLERPMSVQLTRKEKKEGNLRLPLGLKGVGLGLGVNGAPLKNVSRTIEAGNQSLLGGMPSNSGNGSLSDLGGFGQSQLGGGGQHNQLAVIGSSVDVGSGLGRDLGGPLMPLGPPGGILDRPNSSGGVLGMGGLAGSSLRSGSGLGDLGNGRAALFGAGPMSSQRNIVQINNLPAEYTWKALEMLCNSFGDVTFAKIVSRGIGIVHFDGETSARRAVDMLDHQRFEGRYLETMLL